MTYFTIKSVYTFVDSTNYTWIICSLVLPISFACLFCSLFYSFMLFFLAFRIITTKSPLITFKYFFTKDTGEISKLLARFGCHINSFLLCPRKKHISKNFPQTNKAVNFQDLYDLHGVLSMTHYFPGALLTFSFLRLALSLLFGEIPF